MLRPLQLDAYCIRYYTHPPHLIVYLPWTNIVLINPFARVNSIQFAFASNTANSKQHHQITWLIRRQYLLIILCRLLILDDIIASCWLLTPSNSNENVIWRAVSNDNNPLLERNCHCQRIAHIACQWDVCLCFWYPNEFAWVGFGILVIFTDCS